MTLINRLNIGNIITNHKLLCYNILPSTFPNANTDIVCSAGIVQATKWNKCDLFSIASCPHFNPAAKNQANARQAHQAKAAIQQKYNAINNTVQEVDWRWPYKKKQKVCSISKPFE